MALDFNLTTTRYDPLNALALGQIAKLAYEGEEAIKAQAGRWGLEAQSISKNHILAGDTQVSVLSDADKVIVAFRGTQPKDLQDWMSDTEAILVPGPAGMAHKGFLDALNLVYPELRQTVARLQNRSQALWVTGHSLGAALATLFVAKLRFE